MSEKQEKLGVITEAIIDTLLNKDEISKESVDKLRLYVDNVQKSDDQLIDVLFDDSVLKVDVDKIYGNKKISLKVLEDICNKFRNLRSEGFDFTEKIYDPFEFIR